MLVSFELQQNLLVRNFVKSLRRRYVVIGRQLFLVKQLFDVLVIQHISRKPNVYVYWFVWPSRTSFFILRLRLIPGLVFQQIRNRIRCQRSLALMQILNVYEFIQSLLVEFLKVYIFNYFSGHRLFLSFWFRNHRYFHRCFDQIAWTLFATHLFCHRTIEVALLVKPIFRPKTFLRYLSFDHLVLQISFFLVQPVNLTLLGFYFLSLSPSGHFWLLQFLQYRLVTYL